MRAGGGLTCNLNSARCRELVLLLRWKARYCHLSAPPIVSIPEWLPAPVCCQLLGKLCCWHYILGRHISCAALRSRQDDASTGFCSLMTTERRAEHTTFWWVSLLWVCHEACTEFAHCKIARGSLFMQLFFDGTSRQQAEATHGHDLSHGQSKASDVKSVSVPLVSHPAQGVFTPCGKCECLPQPTNRKRGSDRGRRKDVVTSNCQ